MFNKRGNEANYSETQFSLYRVLQQRLGDVGELSD